MNMKKSIMTFAAVLCCIMTAAVFTACSKSNNNDPIVIIPAKTTMSCTLKVESNALNSFDFFASYYDNNGKVQTIQVPWVDSKTELVLINKSAPAKEWTIDVARTKLPATHGVLFKVKPKEGIDHNAEYSFLWGFNMVYYGMDARDGVITNKNWSNESSFNIPEGKMDETFKSGEVILLNNLVTFQTDGSLTNGKWQ